MEYDITSTQNQGIKEIAALIAKPKLRRQSGNFVIEGRREYERALEEGIEIISVYFVPEIIERKVLEESLNKNKSAASPIFYSIPSKVYSKIAYREGTEGVVALAKIPQKSINNIKLSDNPIIVIIESAEKPGNIGAIIRTADAAGADAVIICDPRTDLYNSNVIRASTGGVFAYNIVTSDSEETFNWLKNNNISIYTAQIQDSVPYYKCDMTTGCALVMGSEAEGLTTFWRERADMKIHIPMHGRVDSLNLSVSTAILCYEAVRQRVINDGQLTMDNG